MSDLNKLIKKLEISDEQEEKPSVFWIDGTTYINDYYENQFSENLNNGSAFVGIAMWRICSKESSY